eukprot:symbB.v1.2.021048.t1/scaffold1797.1/size100932/15
MKPGHRKGLQLLLFMAWAAVQEEVFAHLQSSTEGACQSQVIPAGSFSRASHTPRSTQRFMPMRTAATPSFVCNARAPFAPTLRVSPSLEIERADVEAMDWWFAEIESQLALAAPDARCLYPWLQKYPDIKEVEEELTKNFTFQDFKQAPTGMRSKQGEVAFLVRQSQAFQAHWRHIEQLFLVQVAMMPVTGEPKDSRRSSESRTSLGYSIASSALSFALPRPVSLTPRCDQPGPSGSTSGVSGLRQTAQGQCQSAR